MSYIQFNRDSDDFEWLLRVRPTAFLLLAVIAKRAKRTTDHPDKRLEVGEAFIGDFESYGVTRQVYRTDLKFLKFNQLLTIRTTNRGTIVKLIDTNIFNINEEQLTTRNVPNQPSTNHQLTTNNNDKNVNKEKGERKPLSKEKLWEISKNKKVAYEDVVDIHNQVLRTIEEGGVKGKKILSVNLTTQKWIELDIKKGYIQPLDEMGIKINAQYHDPVEVAKMERFKLKVMEDEKNGKPYIDLSRFKN